MSSENDPSIGKCASFTVIAARIKSIGLFHWRHSQLRNNNDTQQYQPFYHIQIWLVRIREKPWAISVAMLHLSP